jgi:hypothetical protein
VCCFSVIEQEVTICIIKPDAVEAGKKDEILEQVNVLSQKNELQTFTSVALTTRPTCTWGTMLP